MSQKHEVYGGRINAEGLGIFLVKLSAALQQAAIDWGPLAPAFYQVARSRNTDRSISTPCSKHVSATSRTAVYGLVRAVVWQGAAGDRRPYADLSPVPLIGNVQKARLGLANTTFPDPPRTLRVFVRFQEAQSFSAALPNRRRPVMSGKTYKILLLTTSLVLLAACNQNSPPPAPAAPGSTTVVPVPVPVPVPGAPGAPGAPAPAAPEPGPPGAPGAPGAPAP